MCVAAYTVLRIAKLCLESLVRRSIPDVLYVGHLLSKPFSSFFSSPGNKF